MKTQNKNQEEKLKLAKKYFIEQKLKEIGLTILIISLIVFIPYLIGIIFTDGTSDFCQEYIDNSTSEWGDSSQLVPVKCGIAGYWFLGLWRLIVTIYFILLIISVISVITIIIYTWLESNWKKAKKRAGLK
jgi:hypothetical protein